MLEEVLISTLEKVLKALLSTSTKVLDPSLATATVGLENYQRHTHAFIAYSQLINRTNTGVHNSDNGHILNLRA